MSDISEINSTIWDNLADNNFDFCQKLSIILEDKRRKNGGWLYSSDIAEAFSLAGDKIEGEKTEKFGATQDRCKLGVKDVRSGMVRIRDLGPKGMVRIRDLGPKSVFNWLSDPLMITVDQKGNRNAVNLRSGYLHKIFETSRDLLSEDTLVHPMMGDFVIRM